MRYLSNQLIDLSFFNFIQNLVLCIIFNRVKLKEHHPLKAVIRTTRRPQESTWK